MFKAYFHAAPMSKHEHTIVLGPAKSLRPTKPVLIIMHRLESEPGAIGQYLKANGIPLDIRRPRFGDILPRTMNGHAGAAIFGGPMSANDPDRYVKEPGQQGAGYRAATVFPLCAQSSDGSWGALFPDGIESRTRSRRNKTPDFEKRRLRPRKPHPAGA